MLYHVPGHCNISAMHLFFHQKDLLLPFTIFTLQSRHSKTFVTESTIPYICSRGNNLAVPSLITPSSDPTSPITGASLPLRVLAASYATNVPLYADLFRQYFHIDSDPSNVRSFSSFSTRSALHVTVGKFLLGGASTVAHHSAHPIGRTPEQRPSRVSQLNRCIINANVYKFCNGASFAHRSDAGRTGNKKNHCSPRYQVKEM